MLFWTGYRYLMLLAVAHVFSSLSLSPHKSQKTKCSRQCTNMPAVVLLPVCLGWRACLQQRHLCRLPCPCLLLCRWPWLLLLLQRLLLPAAGSLQASPAGNDSRQCSKQRRINIRRPASRLCVYDISSPNNGRNAVLFMWPCLS
jgi:hypothetical protein